MPTTATSTFNNAALVPFYRPEDAIVQHVKIPANKTFAKGTVLGEITATPGTFDLYADAGSGGLDTARAILQYDITTDGSGKVTIGGGEWGQKQSSAPAYFSGWFRTAELTGLTAPAVVDLGRLISGSLSDGILHVH